MTDPTAPTEATRIASPGNPRIKAAAGLRDRRDRVASGLAIIDGVREVRRALDAGIDVVEAFICEPLLAGAEARSVLDTLAARGIDATSVSTTAFAKLAFGDRADGIVAIYRPRAVSLGDLALPESPLVVVLEAVEKPGNLGAVLRSADGAGADALVVADPTTDLTNPNVIRASAGTIFAVPTASATSEATIDWLRDRGIRILAAKVDGAVPYTSVDLTGPVAVILGTESDGLTDAWATSDVTAIALPMLGVADSLNVSVTAAILLYEARRQRGTP